MIQSMSSFQLAFPHCQQITNIYSLAVNLGDWTKEALEVSAIWGSVSNRIP
jgi:hypothetical protein